MLTKLTTRTRSDILTTVCALVTKCKEHRAADKVRLHHVIGYLAEYKYLELNYKVADLQLHAFFYALWASHSGLKVTLGHFGFPILYKSQKQKVVTRSSTEAEPPMPVYQDNTSSIKIAAMGHGSSTSNTKFMDLKFQ
jgi:hypothetical protein